jgi:ADP-heptose:LPS heptosyltransferase
VKVLIVRTDRLGDTILASPTWQALKEERDVEISLLIREDFLTLFRHDPSLASVFTLPAEEERDIDRIARELSARNFDALIALFVDRDVARLVRRMPVPLKIGPLSKPRTWFLFNRPVRQGRSRSQMHEADFNGLLLRELGVPYRPRPPRVFLPSADEKEDRALFGRFFQGKDSRPLIVVHPGMGGSAGNWPATRYQELIDGLLREGSATVVVTGTAADGKYMGQIPGIRHPQLVNLVGELDLAQLGLLLRQASVFVGPSTGPMHLATALDTPVVTLFSPVQVQHPRRWGPYHARGTTFLPPVDCPEKYHCRGSRCPHFDCLERISAEDVSIAVRRWMSGESRSPALPGASGAVEIVDRGGHGPDGLFG